MSGPPNSIEIGENADFSFSPESRHGQKGDARGVRDLLNSHHADVASRSDARHLRRGVSTNETFWLRKAVDNHLANGGVGEVWGFCPNWYYEFEGWGTLTKTRTPWMRGDPVAVPTIPATIRAIDYDRRPKCRPVVEKTAANRHGSGSL